MTPTMYKLKARYVVLHGQMRFWWYTDQKKLTLGIDCSFLIESCNSMAHQTAGVAKKAAPFPKTPSALFFSFSVFSLFFALEMRRPPLFVCWVWVWVMRTCACAFACKCVNVLLNLQTWAQCQDCCWRRMHKDFFLVYALLVFPFFCLFLITKRIQSDHFRTLYPFSFSFSFVSSSLFSSFFHRFYRTNERLFIGCTRFKQFTFQFYPYCEGR